MARRKKRLFAPHIPWSFVLWMGFVVCTWIGLSHSHLTDLRTVRVEGAPAGDRAQIEAQLALLQGRQALQVQPESVETKLLDLPDISGATFTRNAFGEARVVLKTYVPTVSIQGTTLGLTDEAVVTPNLANQSGLPLVHLPPGSLQPIAGLSQPMNMVSIVQTTEQLHRIWRDPSSILVVQSDGSMFGSSPTGPQVELGTVADIQKKLAVFSQIMTQHPELMKPEIVINIVDPLHPVERNRIQLSKGIVKT